MILPGIFASQISGHLAVAGNLVSLQTVTVGSGGASSVSFTSIPQTYTHLQVRAIANSSSTSQAMLQMNSDTGNNYAFHDMSGNGSSAGAEGYATGTLNGIAPIVRMGGSSYFGAGILNILDYTNTNKNKVTRTLVGYDAAGSGAVYLASGLWTNTAAITTLTFTIQGGGNFSQYSQFALYGVK